MSSKTTWLDGLDPEQMAKLARRFLQADGSSLAHHQGTAYGQATAYAAAGILGEVHKMRVALDELLALQKEKS